MSPVDVRIAWVSLLPRLFTRELSDANRIEFNGIAAKLIRYMSPCGRVVIFLRADLFVVTNDPAQIAKYSVF